MSFDDSCNFDLDIDSWSQYTSEQEPCNTWRGWKNTSDFQIINKDKCHVTSLVELAAKQVAKHIPFEFVEKVYPPIPEQLQLRIAFWSFPENEDDIRLYSCLANGSGDEFYKGETLFKMKMVNEALQIGFHLSTNIKSLSDKFQSSNVSVLFDRCKITSCNCMCASPSSWCSHVVALCLLRIHKPHLVKYRAPVSESLSRLHRDQLQKFAQYLISELPQQVLPTAQKILDELLIVGDSKINTLSGAPDPTAGGSALEVTQWCLDKSLLHENIKKTLYKLCLPSPIVFSYGVVQFVETVEGREPEGMWNLLNIICEIFKRRDRNAIDLLQIITHECLSYDQILSYWYNTKVAEFHCKNILNRNSGNGITVSTQHACLNLCEEIVSLWCICVLNPDLSISERKKLKKYLIERHINLLEKIINAAGKKVTQVSSAQANCIPLHNGNLSSNVSYTRLGTSTTAVKKFDLETFSGFKPAIEACEIPLPNLKNGSALDYSILSRPSPHAPQELTKFNDDFAFSTSALSQDVSSNNLTVLTPTEAEGKMDFDREIESQALPTALNEIKLGDSFTSHLQNCNYLSVLHDIPFLTVSYPILPQEPSRVTEATKGASLNIEPNILANIRHNFDVQEVLYHQTRGLHYHGFRNKALTHAITLAQLMLSTPPDFLSHQTVPVAYQGPVLLPQPHEDGKEIAILATMPTVNNTMASSNKKKTKKNYKALYNVTQGALGSLMQATFVTTVLCDGHHRDGNAVVGTCGGGVVDNGDNLVKVRNNTVPGPVPRCCCRRDECPSLLALKLGLSRLKILRPPASSKALEVKLSNQESLLANLLIKIPIDKGKYDLLRQEGFNFIDTVSKINSNVSCLLPYTLATLLFETLCSTKHCSENDQSLRSTYLPKSFPNNLTPLNNYSTSTKSKPLKETVKETAAADVAVHDLALEVGLAALEMSHNISEAEYPLLIEGMRRQRGDLALLLLLTYKDDIHKLAQVMDKFLDVNLHRMCPRPLPFYYYTNAEYLNNSLNSVHLSNSKKSIAVAGARPKVQLDDINYGADQRGFNKQSHLKPPKLSCLLNFDGDEGLLNSGEENKPSTSHGATTFVDEDDDDFVLRIDHKIKVKSVSHYKNGMGDDLDEEIISEYSMSSGESSMNNFSLSSSTTFSENHTNKSNNNTGPPINFGKVADGKVADKCNKDQSIFKNQARRTSAPGYLDSLTLSDIKDLEKESPNDELDVTLKPSKTKLSPEDRISIGDASQSVPQSHPTSIESYTGLKHTITLANDVSLANSSHSVSRKFHIPSEAGAHYTFEFAKNLLIKAGGNSNSDLFLHTTPHLLRDDPHHALQFCAFQIGVYALGLHNRVSPNWYSRTYSSHVSWITGQALEIGASAILFLIDTWYTHLTPSEAASLADKASNVCDSTMPYVAAELALSCLNHCQSLSIIETQKALIQCKEQNNEMLEKACSAVENVAKFTAVSPEVLFEVSRHWYWLYQVSISPFDIKPVNTILDPKNAIGNGHWVSYAEQVAQTAPGMSWHFQPTTLHLPLGSYKPNLNQNPFAVGQNQSTTPFPPLFILNGGNRANPNSFTTTPMATSSKPGIVSNNVRLPLQPNINYNNNTGIMPPPIVSQSTTYLNTTNGPPHHNLIAFPPLFNLPPGMMAPMVPPIHPFGQFNNNGNVANTHGLLPTFPYPINQLMTHGDTNPALPLNNYYGNVNNMSNFHYHYYYYYNNLNNNNLVHNNFSNNVYRGSISNPYNLAPKYYNNVPDNSSNRSAEKESPHQGGLCGNKCNDYNALAQPVPPNKATSLGNVEVVSEYAGNGIHKNGRHMLPYENKQAFYLASTFRVGLMAIEALGKKIHDERPQSKYAPNPPYGEDIKWLLRISMQISPQAFQRYCNSVLTCIMSPFILQEVLLEATNYINYQLSVAPAKEGLLDLNAPNFPLNSFAPLPTHITPFALPYNQFQSYLSQPPQMGMNSNLFQHCISSNVPVTSTNSVDSSILITLRAKCCQMYTHWATMRLSHLTSDDYEDFVQLLAHAKWAFLLTPDGSSHFNDFLQNLRRSKSLKKIYGKRFYKVSKILEINEVAVLLPI